MNMMNAEVVIRSQHSRGSGGGKYGGPDTYVAVLAVPPGTVSPRVLRGDLLERRGIAWTIAGEGYARHRGERSALGCAIRRAESLAERIRQIPEDLWKKTYGPLSQRLRQAEEDL